MPGNKDVRQADRQTDRPGEINLHDPHSMEMRLVLARWEFNVCTLLSSSTA